MCIRSSPGAESYHSQMGDVNRGRGTFIAHRGGAYSTSSQAPPYVPRKYDQRFQAQRDVDRQPHAPKYSNQQHAQSSSYSRPDYSHYTQRAPAYSSSFSAPTSSNSTSESNAQTSSKSKFGVVHVEKNIDKTEPMVDKSDATATTSSSIVEPIKKTPVETRDRPSFDSRAREDQYPRREYQQSQQQRTDNGWRNSSSSSSTSSCDHYRRPPPSRRSPSPPASRPRSYHSSQQEWKPASEPINHSSNDSVMKRKPAYEDRKTQTSHGRGISYERRQIEKRRAREKLNHSWGLAWLSRNPTSVERYKLAAALQEISSTLQLVWCCEGRKDILDTIPLHLGLVDAESATFRHDSYVVDKKNNNTSNNNNNSSNSSSTLTDHSSRQLHVDTIPVSSSLTENYNSLQSRAPEYTYEPLIYRDSHQSTLATSTPMTSSKETSSSTRSEQVVQSSPSNATTSHNQPLTCDLFDGDLDCEEDIFAESLEQPSVATDIPDVDIYNDILNNGHYSDEEYEGSQLDEDDRSQKRKTP